MTIAYSSFKLTSFPVTNLFHLNIHSVRKFSFIFEFARQRVSALNLPYGKHTQFPLPKRGNIQNKKTLTAPSTSYLPTLAARYSFKFNKSTQMQIRAVGGITARKGKNTSILTVVLCIATLTKHYSTTNVFCIS